MIDIMNLNIFNSGTVYTPHVDPDLVTGYSGTIFLNPIHETFFNANQNSKKLVDLIFPAGTTVSLIVRAYDNFALGDSFQAISTIEFQYLD